MKTTQRIDLKRQELNYLRHDISSILGPPHNKKGLGFGLLLAAFVAGVIVERRGWRQIGHQILSMNRLVPMLAPAIVPAMTAMHH